MKLIPGIMSAAPKFCCRHDYLKITDDNNVQVSQYCGYLNGTVVFVFGDFAIITFHSDYLSNNKNKGFHIRFTEIPGKYKYESSSTYWPMS